MARYSDQVILDAYEKTGNIWKAAEIVGCSGQTIQERLKRMGVDRNCRPLTRDEKTQIKEFYERNRDTDRDKLGLDKLAQDLGRSKHLICRCAREMGLTKQGRGNSEEDRARLSRNAREWHATHEHPRGATGMTHSSETKMHTGQRSKNWWANATDEQRETMYLKQMETRRLNGSRWPNNQGGGGYRNIKRGYRDDLDFFARSAWEANWARYLNFLISNRHDPLERWEYEPDAFWFEPLRQGVVCYTPDFKLFEKGREPYYHEVKGRMDAKSKTKLKRMAKYHPNVRVEVIDEKAYREVERKLGAAIPNWEF